MDLSHVPTSNELMAGTIDGRDFRYRGLLPFIFSVLEVMQGAWPEQDQQMDMTWGLLQICIPLELSFFWVGGCLKGKNPVSSNTRHALEFGC